jgi:MFS family permease
MTPPSSPPTQQPPEDASSALPYPSPDAPPIHVVASPTDALSAQHQAVDPWTPGEDLPVSLLRNQNFLCLWIAQVFSQLADRIVFVVFINAIAVEFGASDRLNSGLYVAFTIPAILLTAIAGVFVDRWPRRLTLVSTNWLRAFSLLLLPWTINQHQVLWVYALAFVQSAATQFFVPAEAATIPQVASKKQILEANALFTTTMMGSVIFGFALGDPFITLFTERYVHWALAGLFFLAGAVLFGLRVPKNDTPTCQTNPSGPSTTPPCLTLKDHCRQFLADLREGFFYIQETPAVLRAMLKLALLFSGVVAMCLLFVSFAQKFLYESPQIAAQKFGHIIAVSGLGMTLGAVVLSRLGHVLHGQTRHRVVDTGLCLIGLMLAALTLITVVSPAMHQPTGIPGITARILYTFVCALMMGVGGSLVAVPLQSTLHELIPEDKRGKVMGVQFTLLSTASTLPAVLVGFGAEFLGVRSLLSIIATPFIAIGLMDLLATFIGQGPSRPPTDSSRP